MSGESPEKAGWSGLKVVGRKIFLNSIVQALVVVLVVVVFIVVVFVLPPCSLWLSPYSGALSRAEWGAGAGGI